MGFNPSALTRGRAPQPRAAMGAVPLVSAKADCVPL
jgi:hypothetical protein